MEEKPGTTWLELWPYRVIRPNLSKAEKPLFPGWEAAFPRLRSNFSKAETASGIVRETIIPRLEINPPHEDSDAPSLNLYASAEL